MSDSTRGKGKRPAVPTICFESLRKVELGEFRSVDETILRLRNRRRALLQRLIRFDFDASDLELVHPERGETTLRQIIADRRRVLMFIAGGSEEEETFRYLAQLDALLPHLPEAPLVVVIIPDAAFYLNTSEVYRNITLLSERDGSFCYNLGLMELYRNGRGIRADYIPSLLLFTRSAEDRLTLVGIDFVLSGNPAALLTALVEVLERE